MKIGTLINFIERQLDEGTDEKIIREALLKAGYLPIEIDEAFGAVAEREAPVVPEIPAVPQAPKTALKKFPWSKILIVGLILAVGVSAYFYQKASKLDPISLLPEDTAFYLRIKIHPQDQQVKNLKGLLQRFPNYELACQKIEEEFEKLKQETQALDHLDFTIGREIILAYVAPFDAAMEEFADVTEELAFVLIVPNPDLQKALQISQDIEAAIAEDEDWEIEKETYKERTISKVVPVKKQDYQPLSKGIEESGAATFTDGHLIVALRVQDIKKIIDLIEDQKITKSFEQDRIKSLSANPAHKTLQKYFSKDYWALFYSRFSWSEILETAERTEILDKTVRTIPPVSDLLKAGLNWPFFGTEKSEASEEMVMAALLIAEKDEIKTEVYALDLREDPYSPAQFTFKDSLAKFIPAKIGNKEIMLYGEQRDLKGYFEEQIKIWTEQMTLEEREELDEAMELLNEFFNVDFENDILSLFDQNYAFFVASEPTGEMPRAGLVFEIDDGNKTKENLLKIKIPKEVLGLGLEESRSSAKDARVIADIMQMRSAAEIDYTYQQGYSNVSCSHGDVKVLCADIEDQVGIMPTIHASQAAYCVYVKLNEPGAYYCADSEFNAAKTYINPGGIGYCAGLTFVCPEQGTPPPLPPEERIGFSKETIDGFEIYFFPIHDEFALSFAIKDKKLIFTFTKKGLTEILEAISDPVAVKLKDSQIFTEQLQGMPKNISCISYVYPYGFLGLIKYGVNFSIDAATTYFFMMAPEAGMEMDFASMILPPIFEFLDKGIAPYLKVLQVSTSYSFVPEQGLTAVKGRLVIEELPDGEKQACEDFWANIEQWLEEKEEQFRWMFGGIMFPDIWGNSGSFMQGNGEKAKEYIEEAMLIMEGLELEQIESGTDIQKQEIANLVAQAVTLAQQATELGPDNAEIWFQRGNIYFELIGYSQGAKEWAINCYEEALELDPTNFLYQEKLKECEAK